MSNAMLHDMKTSVQMSKHLKLSFVQVRQCKQVLHHEYVPVLGNAMEYMEYTALMQSCS